MSDYNPLSVDVAPAESTRRIRRLVTGVDAEGRSTIVLDDVSPHVRVGHGCPTYVVTDLWRTQQSPADNAGPVTDPLAMTGPIPVAPPETGTVFRVVEFPPDRDWRFDADGQELKPPAFHVTASIDYAILLAGELWALMDTTEVRMTAGDVLVQRGTVHAWSNRSEEPAVLACILVGGSLAAP